MCGRWWVSIARAAARVWASGTGCGRVDRVVRSWARKSGAMGSMGLMSFKGGIEVIFEALWRVFRRSGGNGVSRDRGFELTYIEFCIIGLN